MKAKREKKDIEKRQIKKNNKKFNKNKGNNIRRKRKGVKTRNKKRSLESKEDIENYVGDLYDRLLKSKLQCIPLTSSDPAYNPYHPLLTIGGENVNIREALGNPLLPEESSDADDINHCHTVKCEGCTSTCTFTLSQAEEESITVTDTKGNTFSHTYGQTFGESSTYSDEIINTLEVINSLTKSNSTSSSKSEGRNVSAEHIINITNTESETKSDEVSDTHTDERSTSYCHSISEETSHTNSTGHSTIDETNWSHTTETSKTSEYSRMQLSNYTKGIEDAKKNHKRYILEEDGLVTLHKRGWFKLGLNAGSKLRNILLFFYELLIYKRISFKHKFNLP